MFLSNESVALKEAQMDMMALVFHQKKLFDCVVKL